MKWHQIYFELSLEWYLVDGTVCDLSSITFLQLSDIANANAAKLMQGIFHPRLN